MSRAGIASVADFRIVPGQRLRLNPPPGARTKPLPGLWQRSPRASPRASPDDPAHRPPDWHWPVAGRAGVRHDHATVRRHRACASTAALNQPVFAAADGRVVYTGSGLRGYGQLVIITHERGWLSAYGHNALVHVHEGDTVRAGKAIATMGFGPAQQPMLYFEIRLDGRPLTIPLVARLPATSDPVASWQCFRDRARQGCRALEARDVFTACPESTVRNAGPFCPDPIR